MFFIVGMLELYNAKMPASTVKKNKPNGGFSLITERLDDS